MFDQVNRFRKTVSEGTVLLNQLVKGRVRMARLQVVVDKQGEDLIRHLSVGTVAEVIEVRNIYDKDWFAKCLYSEDVKRRLAQKLLDQTRRFSSMIDLTVWTEIAEGRS
jgi:hypothetical protein